jgi:hypothetical protein
MLMKYTAKHVSLLDPLSAEQWALPPFRQNTDWMIGCWLIVPGLRATSEKCSEEEEELNDG